MYQNISKSCDKIIYDFTHRFFTEKVIIFLKLYKQVSTSRISISPPGGKKSLRSKI